MSFGNMPLAQLMKTAAGPLDSYASAMQPPPLAPMLTGSSDPRKIPQPVPRAARVSAGDAMRGSVLGPLGGAANVPSSMEAAMTPRALPEISGSSPAQYRAQPAAPRRFNLGAGAYARHLKKLPEAPNGGFSPHPGDAPPAMGGQSRGPSYDPIALANRARSLAAASRRGGQFDGPVGTSPFRDAAAAKNFLNRNPNFAQQAYNSQFTRR